MGCPDTVIAKCPACGADMQFQSKSGPNKCLYYTLEQAPDEVLYDVNRHCPATCDCGARLVVVVSTFNGRFVAEIK